MELVPEGMRLVRLQTPRVENAVNGVSKPNGKPDDQAFCPRGITIAELHRKYTCHARPTVTASSEQRLIRCHQCTEAQVVVITGSVEAVGETNA